MRNRSVLLMALAAACLLAAWSRPAAAYVSVISPTLGALCNDSVNVYVLRVEKASAEKGVILFKCVEVLKGKPDSTAGKHVIPTALAVGGEKSTAATDDTGPKLILDWATEGKTAVLFTVTRGDDPGGFVKGVGHAYIDNFWYTLNYDRNGQCWVAFKSELSLLTRYCGPADKFGDAVAKILRGEEVVVPAMVGDNRQDLLQRRAKVQDLRASLQLLDDPKRKGVDQKKPDEPQPDRVGTVKALAADGKSFTLLPAPTVKNKEPAAIDIQITEGTKITAGNEAGKLAVGQTASVWLQQQKGGSSNIAVKIQIGKPPEKPEDVKPVEKKPDDKKPSLSGTVKAVAADGKGFSLQPAPTKTDAQPAAVDIQIGEKTKITSGKEPGKLVVGQAVTVWLEAGTAKVAAEIQIGKPVEPPQKKPAPDVPEKKPEAPPKPKEPANPPRDPAPTAAIIDTQVDKHLAANKVPSSPQADDAEFLRRVTLDLTGRIPTYQQTVAFLDNNDPDKRRKLIDKLLESPEYGEHFGTIWRNLLSGRELNVTGKGGTNTDTFRTWLTEQFNDNRGWNAIVTELLTAEGTPRDNPATAFLLTNGENGQPRPNKATGTAAALFWGINLRCAECHNHPFAKWKQPDFWGTAAFFGKVQYAGAKGGGQPSLIEALGGSGSSKEKGQPGAPAVRGTAIVIPTSSGKAAGQVVKARFLGGDEPALDENEPFRPRFAAWATSADNPYFARSAVNRMWSHFFGRGFVNPLDSFDTNSPSHPELLDRLTKEFASSGFDFKHLARCITTSKAYQRTSRPVPGNESDTVAFSHMAVKVLTPEVLYDALGVIGKGGASDAGKGGKGGGEKQESREQFLRSFRVDENASPTDYIQGIPEMLRLMNASSPNRGAAVVDKLFSAKASPTEAITTLYLTVLSRRPRAEEVELMEGYLSRHKDDREGYRGVMWILLNSSEFALNR